MIDFVVSPRRCGLHRESDITRVPLRSRRCKSYDKGRALSNGLFGLEVAAKEKEKVSGIWFDSSRKAVQA